MNSGSYAACAALVARTQALDTIASNVANSSSSGFRGQKNIFGSVLAEASHHGRMTALNRATNSYGTLSGTEMDQTQGTIGRTGNELDLALEGPGYFKVKTTNGVAYTRNGGFQLSTKGQLTTASGDFVLGESGPIQLIPGTVTISGDGTISSAGAIVARLRVVTFASSTKLTSQGTAYYAGAEDKELPAAGTSVRQGALESSNVSPVEGVVELIRAQRAAESMRHVLSMLDGEMDKTAAGDLARVNL